MERKIQIPKNAEIVQGEIADYYFDRSGILISFSKNPRRTVENIKRNVALVKQITSNRKAPLLIYLCDSPVPDKATRQFSQTQLPEIYSAMAMVSKPGLSQLVMKMVFRFSKPPIPIQSFSDDAKAYEWLRQYL